MTRPPTIHCLKMVPFIFPPSSSSPAVLGTLELLHFRQVSHLWNHFSISPLWIPCSWQQSTELHSRHLSGVHPAHVCGWLLGNKSRLSVNHISKEIHKSCPCLEHINPYCHEYSRHTSLGLHTNLGPVTDWPWWSGRMAWRRPHCSKLVSSGRNHKLGPIQGNGHELSGPWPACPSCKYNDGLTCSCAAKVMPCSNCARRCHVWRK